MSAMFKRILCPVDLETGSSEALRTASAIARQQEAKLYLLHVVAPDAISGPVIAPPVLVHRASEHAREELQRLAGSELSGLDHEVLLRFGQPASEIIATETETKADLVILATHARKGVARLLIGSVAERVIRESSCPVLTLHV